MPIKYVTLSESNLSLLIAWILEGISLLLKGILQPQDYIDFSFFTLPFHLINTFLGILCLFCDRHTSLNKLPLILRQKKRPEGILASQATTCEGWWNWNFNGEFFLKKGI